MQPTKQNIIMFLSDISGRKPLYREFTGLDPVLPQGSNNTSSQSLSQWPTSNQSHQIRLHLPAMVLGAAAKCNHGAVFNHPRPPPSQ